MDGVIFALAMYIVNDKPSMNCYWYMYSGLVLPRDTCGGPEKISAAVVVSRAVGCLAPIDELSLAVIRSDRSWYDRTQR